LVKRDPKDTIWNLQVSGRERRHSCRVRLAASIFQPAMDPELRGLG
jgi:hypothetical protein